MKWETLKIEIEKEISKTGITDEGFIKLLLKFNRNVNTLRNMIKKNSFSYVIESKVYDDAASILEKIRIDHSDIYSTFNKINGHYSSYNLGDYLA